MGDNSVLVIAFDGLDKELIEKFNLQNVKQHEYGDIDNKTGMSIIKTGELFASFITGKTYEEHGVKGLRPVNIALKDRIIDKLFPTALLQNLRGATRLQDTLKTALNYRDTRADKHDLKTDTLFEEIENSKALFVPSYNRTPFSRAHGTGFELRNLLVEEKPSGYIWDLHEYPGRKEKLFRPINKWYDFTMVHFHRPDAHQHFYGDKNIGSGHDLYDEEKLKKLYKETDELAGKILDYFQDDYSYIIFMSDHGLPTEKAHNENAFYSCNKELFGDNTPKITEFHDKIIELTGE
jgi:hypothetical protein